jgi:hypothetical protein
MVVLYFLPMFIVIALLAGRVARRGASTDKPNKLQIVLGLLAVFALGFAAFWFVGLGR